MHLTHTLAAFIPVPVEYSPLPHSVQTGIPCPVAYVPLGHLRQFEIVALPATVA